MMPNKPILPVFFALLVLAFVAQSQAQHSGSPQFRIAGTVVSSANGSALSQARVTIAEVKSPSNTQSVITGDDGRFEFTRLRPGKYTLQGARQGFIAGSYDQHDQFSSAIVTGVDVDSEHLVLRLVPDAVLSGTITDEAGEPVRKAQVNLYRETHAAGVTRIVQFRAGSTDDRGMFEFAPLNPGNYFVSATATPWYAVHVSSKRTDAADDSSLDNDRTLDVAYATTYYGDVTEADDSTPIPIRGGDRFALAIHLTPVPSLHFIFHAADAKQGVAMPLLQKRVFDTVQQIQGQTMQQLSPGVFEVSGIPPGRYTVSIPASNPGGYSQSTDMNLTRDGEELDRSNGQAGSSVKITVPDRVHLPLQLAIALQNSERHIVAYRMVESSGEVNFANVEAGDYTVLVGAPGKAYSVARISWKQSNTSGHTLKVPAGSSLEVTVTLSGGEVEVEGFATKAGKPLAGSMIVLIPNDPEANRELFRRDQSDLDGSFQLHSVIPGSYTITAIQDGWDLDWSKPGVIAAYAKHGQAVTIAPESRGTVHLVVAVEVQGSKP